MIAAERHFAGRQRLAQHLAADAASALKRTIEAQGHATFAVSGGTTPILFFETLSHMAIAWSSVTVTLVDERMVPEESERSNARLVKKHLFQDRAEEATFVPLFNNPAAQDIANFDIVHLGMGKDGHTASYFPGGDTLEKALDPDGTEKIIEISAPGSGEPRLTFTLPMLLKAPHILLHIEGPEKRQTLDRALAAGPIEDMPVRAVLRSTSPVTLYWCR